LAAGFLLPLGRDLARYAA